MPRFVLHHPSDPAAHASYGRDDKRGGPWAGLEIAGATIVYDITVAAYHEGAPVHGRLVFLGQFGFVGTEDIAEALGWLHDRGDPGRQRPRRGVRRVLRVISNLEAGG